MSAYGPKADHLGASATGPNMAGLSRIYQRPGIGTGRMGHSSAFEPNAFLHWERRVITSVSNEHPLVTRCGNQTQADDNENSSSGATALALVAGMVQQASDLQKTVKVGFTSTIAAALK
jgi:hypothetical protein